MPYTVHLLPIDDGGFIDTGLKLNGAFVSITPAPATDTATATAASPATLAFMAATPPPPGVATLYVANSGPAGDLFRSGLFTGLPPSPGTLTVLSFPTSLTSMPSAAFATTVSASVGTILLTPPNWLVGTIATLSLGAYIPQGGAITGVVPALASGSMTLTVTGFFNFRVYYFFTDTITFTATFPVTIAPSGDAGRPSRILSVTTGAMTLSIFTTGPSGLLSLVTGVFGPALAALLQPQIDAALESAINGTIDKLVAPGLASKRLLRSPTSVVSARRVTITSSGIGLALVLADLFGPAFTMIPENLHAQVSPAPQAGSQRAYTVTVTNTATGTPINQADVTLLNYTAKGTPQTVGPLQTNTNGSGQVTFNVALQPRITHQVDPITHERTRVFHPPTLTVSKMGYNTINIRLLEDPGDL